MERGNAWVGAIKAITDTNSVVVCSPPPPSKVDVDANVVKEVVVEFSFPAKSFA